MSDYETLKKLIEAEKAKKEAEKNLRIIDDQFNFRQEIIVPKGFWDKIKEAKLYDEQTFTDACIFRGNMDSCLIAIREGFFKEKQIERIYRPWKLSIREFISQKEKQIANLRKQLGEKYKEFCADNQKLNLQEETLDGLLKFLMG